MPFCADRLRGCTSSLWLVQEGDLYVAGGRQSRVPCLPAQRCSPLERCYFSAHVYDLALYTRTQFGKGETKLARTTPLDCGLLYGERVASLRIDPTLKGGAKRNSHRTGDAAPPRREVSEFTLTGHDLTF